MATIALGMACFSYARIVGMEKSTHKIEWMPIPTPQEDAPTEEDAQDLPPRLRTKKPQTISDQMMEHAYKDIEKEMV